MREAPARVARTKRRGAESRQGLCASAFCRNSANIRRTRPYPVPTISSAQTSQYGVVPLATRMPQLAQGVYPSARQSSHMAGPGPAIHLSQRMQLVTGPFPTESLVSLSLTSSMSPTPFFMYSQALKRVQLPVYLHYDSGSIVLVG